MHIFLEGYIDFYFTPVICTPHDQTWRKPMARREITGKKLSGANPREPQPVPTLAMSIPQFCTAHNISEGFYYKMKKQKLNPREMKVGTRTLITFEAAADWRAKRQGPA
jgi:hypothetical protein